MRIKSKITVTLLLLASSIQCIFAGPWLKPGNMAVKSDIDLLADNSYIIAPVLTWPIAWVNIGPELLSKASKKRIKTSAPDVQQAYQRILTLYKSSQAKHQTTLRVSGGHNINPFRTFAWQPRADFTTSVSTSYTNASHHFAGKLEVSYGDYADLTRNVHLGGSYLYGLFGNWAVGFDKVNRWWSPAYSDSLILSNNAAPLPTFTVQRLRAYPFKTKWLSWLGPWSLTSSLSVGSPNTPVTHPLIWLTNFTFRPIPSLQFSLSRVAYFAGDQRPLTWAMLKNLLLFQDNAYDDKGHGNTSAKDAPGTEHVETTVLWSLFPRFHMHLNFYLHIDLI